MISVPGFGTIKDRGYDQWDDASKGVYGNWTDNPAGAARNAVRSMGGNPRINSYAARLASKAHQNSIIAQLEAALNGDTVDNDAMQGIITSGMGRGLLPQSPKRGQDILGKLSELMRIEPEDSAGLSVPQSILRTMFSQGGAGGSFRGDSGQGSNASDIIQMLMGMGLPSMFGQHLQSTLQDKQREYSDYYEPANPNNGFLDFLTRR